jgi:hypothetical protein
MYRQSRPHAATYGCQESVPHVLTRVHGTLPKSEKVVNRLLRDSRGSSVAGNALMVGRESVAPGPMIQGSVLVPTLRLGMRREEALPPLITGIQRNPGRARKHGFPGRAWERE